MWDTLANIYIIFIYIYVYIYMHIIKYIYMAYEPLANWDTPSSHPQFVDCPTWQMEHHVFQNEFFGFQVSTPNIKATYHPMMEYQPCFKPTVSDDLYFMCAMVVCYMVGVWSSRYHSGFPRFIPTKKWFMTIPTLSGWWLSLPLWKIWKSILVSWDDYSQYMEKYGK